MTIVDLFRQKGLRFAQTPVLFSSAETRSGIAALCENVVKSAKAILSDSPPIPEYFLVSIALESSFLSAESETINRRFL